MRYIRLSLVSGPITDIAVGQLRAMGDISRSTKLRTEVHSVRFSMRGTGRNDGTRGCVALLTAGDALRGSCGFCELLGRSVRVFSRDGSDKDFDEFRSVAHVDVMELPAKGDLIAPGCRQQVSVGVAADVTQKSLMIDAAARFLVKLPINPLPVRTCRVLHQALLESPTLLPGLCRRGAARKFERVD